MITEEYLIAELQNPTGVDFISETSEQIIAQGFPISFLHSLNFNKDRRISFRSAWVLEKIIWKDVNNIQPILPQMLANYNSIPNSSVARHYNKILIHLFELRAKNKLPESLCDIIDLSDDEVIIEGCFKWILTPKCPVAPLAWALEILLYYKDKHSWLKEELLAIVQKLILNGSPGMKNYGTKYLKRLTFSNCND